MSAEKIKVEIWSDVMCPFCYIGKRKFEEALEKFAHKKETEVEWKSFQLNPHLITDPTKNTLQHLAESKGWTRAYTESAVQHVVEMAKDVGLNYNFENAVVANSFDAHRLIQYAKLNGKGDEVEEELFKAYFTEGKNTGDVKVLLQIGVAAGLAEEELNTVLSSDDYTTNVELDLREARELGIGGVPFFVFDRKLAVSGAQNSQVFFETLEKAWESKEKQPAS